MELVELVRALRDHDPLTARQWVADARRAELQLADLPVPKTLDAVDLAIAAGVIELLASRWGQRPPNWTSGVRRRRLLAPPDFLTTA